MLSFSLYVYLHLHVTTFDGLLLWPPSRKVKRTGQSWHLEQTRFEFQLWISFLGSEELGRSILLQQIPGMLVAIFIMHCGQSLTEDTPGFFLRQEYRHQLMDGPKVTLFTPERPLGEKGGLLLGKGHVMTHSQTCPAPMRFVEADWHGQAVLWPSVLNSSCSTFCSENSSWSCLLGRRIPVFAVCHWSVMHHSQQSSFWRCLLTCGDCASC